MKRQRYKGRPEGRDKRPPMRLLVCGSRGWDDEVLVKRAFDHLRLRFRIRVVIQGEAAGADTQARQVANLAGLPVLAFPAQWRLYEASGAAGGKNPAGHIRNQQMIDEGKPTHCLAFSCHRPPRGGTSDMLHRAWVARLPVAVLYGRGEVLKWEEPRRGFFDRFGQTDS